MSNAFPWVFSIAMVMGALAGVSCLRTAPRWSIPRTLTPTVTWLLVLIFLALGAASIGSGEAASWSIDYFAIPSPGATVSVGVVATRAGVAAGALFALILGYVFLFEPLASKQKSHSAFVPGAAALALCGTTLSWWSSSLWGILLGQVVAGVSGWLVLVNSGRDVGDGAEMATTYSRERTVGMLVSLLGLAVILSGGGSTTWSDSKGLSASDQPVGLGLLFLGALLQTGVFPAMGWSVQAPMKFRGPLTHALLVTSCSSWCGLAMVYRLIPDLTSSGLSAWLAAPAMLLSALTSWSAISSALSGGGLTALSAASSSLSCAILLLAGRQAGGTAAFLFVALSWATALVLRGSTENQKKDAELPERLLKALISFSWSGGLCFAGAAVLVSCLGSLERAIDGASFVVSWVMLSLASLCGLSPAARNQPKSEEAWSVGWRMSAPGVILIFSSAIFWTGEWLGVFTGTRESEVGPALGAELFGSAGQSGAQTGQLISWAWMVALALLLLFQIPERIIRSGALSWKFAAAGFGAAASAEWFVASLRAATGLSDRIARARWVQATQVRTSALAAVMIAAISKADQWLRGRIDSASRGAVEIPAKGLQLLVSGSVQSYLLFTIGFTLALLLHFWNHINH